MSFEEIIHHKKGHEPSKKVVVQFRKVKEFQLPPNKAEMICRKLLSTLPETCHGQIRVMFPFMEAADESTTAWRVDNHQE